MFLYSTSFRSAQTVALTRKQVASGTCLCTGERDQSLPSFFEPFQKPAQYGILIVQLYRNNGTPLSSVYHRSVISRQLHDRWTMFYKSKITSRTRIVSSIPREIFYKIYRLATRTTGINLLVWKMSITGENFQLHAARITEASVTKIGLFVWNGRTMRAITVVYSVYNE